MAGIRTFTRSVRTTSDDTTISPDATLRPPFKEQPLTGAGFFSDQWVAWLTKVSDRLFIATQSTAISATMYTGTSTTDGSGVFTATWPTPFSSVFLGLSIANTDPLWPGGVFSSVTSITLGSYSATLNTTDNLYPTPTVTVQPGVTFNWVVQGF